MTALTLYGDLQVASAKGNAAHKSPSSSGAGPLGVSRSALLHPLCLVLILLGGVGPDIIVSVSLVDVSSSNEVSAPGWFISSVWVPIVGGKDVICRGACLIPTTDCTHWHYRLCILAFTRVALASTRLESSGSLVGTGPIDVTLSGITFLAVGAVLTGCVRPALSLQ